jgi:hypothetical protein
MVSRRRTTGQKPKRPEDIFLQKDFDIRYSDVFQKVAAVTRISGYKDTVEYRLLGRDFLQAVKRGNPETVLAYLKAGMPVNYQDPKTKQAALHVAAACKAREAIRALASRPDCNFILRDRHGRLPSELAYEFGVDPALARYLTIKEFKQAKAEGCTLKYRKTLPKRH